MVDSSHLRLALASAALLGFRHGLDYDHIAAITDITSVQLRVRDAMRYGLLYVAGHATTIAVLGAAAVGFRISLPASSDRWAEKLVGATLLILGVYVLGTLLRPSAHGHAHPKTRITLLVNGLLWIYWRLSRVFGGTRVEAPQLFKDGYGASSTFVVGVIHGLGAETPTQILLFLVAANLGGTATGMLGLFMFIMGLLAMNTLMCASAAGLFSVALAGPHAPLAQGTSLGTLAKIKMGLSNFTGKYGLRSLTVLTAAYSIVVGAIFLLGSADKLPSLTG